ADADAVYGPITKHLHAEQNAATIENIRKFCSDVQVSQPDTTGMVDVTFGHVVIDLSELEPMGTLSPSPDNVRTIADEVGKPVRQVVIGSCTNSSFQDLMLVAAVLKGRRVHPDVELGIAPGSKQVLTMMGENGALADIIAAGGRILESGCGPCIGQGFSPAENTISLRTFNRNFAGRTGTKGDTVYLVSPETAVAAALTGEITDPRDLTTKLGIEYPTIPLPEKFLIDDGMLQAPPDESEAAGIEVVRGSTIVKPPAGEVLPDELSAKVVIKVEDKITTDHIMPAGSLLKYRSNVPEYAKYVFDCFTEDEDEEGNRKPSFADRALACKAAGVGGVIVAGESYGQGSSREHAALCPMYLGIRAVIAKSIERIHQANLVNFAILPLAFCNPSDYDTIDAEDELKISGTGEAIASADTVTVENVTKKTSFECKVMLAPRQRKILANGGLLNHTRKGV
ncbi:MAG: hypothetical protein KAR11_05825, partial [Phycisphaerae bacterium]|nr:hypothetical protein [Phycisphaerae bacterium]